MASVFLSHSSDDKPLVRRIASDLEAAGIIVWFDEWNILVGDQITQRISEGLDQSDFVVVVLSQNSLRSGWVEKEWQSKVADEATTREIAILPLLADECQVPTLLRDKKYARIGDDYSSAINEVITAVNGHVARRNAAAAIPRSMRNSNPKRNISSEDQKSTSIFAAVVIVAMVLSLIGFAIVVFTNWNYPLIQLGASAVITVGNVVVLVAFMLFMGLKR